MRKLSRNPKFHNRTKYIDIRHYFIRERVEAGEIDILRVDTKFNITDILIKPLYRDRIRLLIQMMGIEMSEEEEA